MSLRTSYAQTQTVTAQAGAVQLSAAQPSAAQPDTAQRSEAPGSATQCVQCDGAMQPKVSLTHRSVATGILL